MRFFDSVGTFLALLACLAVGYALGYHNGQQANSEKVATRKGDG